VYTSIRINNSGRSWEWLLCNSLGYWRESAPNGYPSLVSRLLTPDYDNRQCGYYFPNTFNASSPANPRTVETNSKYGGWNANVTRLFSTNGQRDPWREASVSADNYTQVSSATQPILVSDAFHTSDLLTSAGVADASVAYVQSQAKLYFKTWLAEWHAGSTNSTVVR